MISVGESRFEIQVAVVVKILEVQNAFGRCFVGDGGVS